MPRTVTSRVMISSSVIFANDRALGTVPSIVLAIVALGLLSIANAAELARGSLLARSVCAYIALFWGIRLSLQAVLDVKEHLTTWWLRAESESGMPRL